MYNWQNQSKKRQEDNFPINLPALYVENNFRRTSTSYVLPEIIQVKMEILTI
jgi:hypothetical protein